MNTQGVACPYVHEKFALAGASEAFGRALGARSQKPDYRIEICGDKVYSELRGFPVEGVKATYSVIIGVDLVGSLTAEDLAAFNDFSISRGMFLRISAASKNSSLMGSETVMRVQFQAFANVID